jgi:2-polyprenyl-3-methyl-5-hydroxy-6-metoxy-1,4-benzoquinol methylase
MARKLETTARSCYVCASSVNPIVAVEESERRFGRPVMPEGVYRFARCRTCDTLYVDSNVTDAYLADLYKEETIDVGAERSEEGSAHEQVLELRLPEFRKNWARMKQVRPPKPGDHLLDLGCQMGDFGACAQRDGVQPHGIELSEFYAKACRSRWGTNSQVHCGPIASADFKGLKFQYISAFETLEHMCDPISVLLKFRDWLAPDGLLAISVPSSDYFHFKFWLLRQSPVATVLNSVFKRRSAFYASQVLPHTHIYNFSHTSVRMILDRSGYRVLNLGLTGWHGRIGSLLHLFGQLGENASKRFGFAPSLIALAVPDRS